MNEVDLQPVGDLLRTPPLDPASIASMRFVLPLPGRALGAEDFTVISDDPARETILDVIAEAVVGCELGYLGTFRSPLGMPLSKCCFVFEAKRSS